MRIVYWIAVLLLVCGGCLPDFEAIEDDDVSDDDDNTGDDDTSDDDDTASGCTDIDGDGYGSPGDESCPSGPEEDCDDADADTFPGSAPEDSATACMTDADQDGYGDGTPGPGVQAGSDCDDQLAEVNPGASEVCNDGIDNDCDSTDNGCSYSGAIDLALADVSFLGESEGDKAGWAVASAGDVNGDGHIDVVVGARFHDAGGEDAGAAYLMLGPHTSTTSLSTAAAVLIGEEPGDYSGVSVAGAGDVNNDGFDDILVGAFHGATGATLSGQAYLVNGPIAGNLDLSAADAKFVGEAFGNYAGYAVAPAGDQNGDGNADFLVGASGNDEGAEMAGAVYLLLGPKQGVIDLSLADAKIVGESAYDYSGAHIHAGGDVDGDGETDVLIGASKQDAGGGDAGAAYLVSGPITGPSSLSNATAKLVGEAPGDECGTAVSIARDLNGDGLDDLLIGAPYEDEGGADAGAAYVVYGPVSGTLGLAAADVKFVGEAADDHAGNVVASAGDVNADGYLDVLVNAKLSDLGGADSGVAYLLYGPILGDLVLSAADAVFHGEFAGDGVYRVAPGGDLNQDGFDDFLVSAPENDNAANDAGAAYLIHGRGL